MFDRSQFFTLIREANNQNSALDTKRAAVWLLFINVVQYGWLRTLLSALRRKTDCRSSHLRPWQTLQHLDCRTKVRS